MSERYWKHLALWAMDCHAATAEELMALKGTPPSRVARLKRICERGASAIVDAGAVGVFLEAGRYSTHHDVVRRLRRVLEET